MKRPIPLPILGDGPANIPPPAHSSRRDSRSAVSQYGLPELGSQPFIAPQIRDVTSYTLGVGTVSGFCESLIGRNSPVPHEVGRQFSTSKDDQTTVRIQVFQGDSRRLGENMLLGDVILENLPARPRAHTTIEVTFTLDASGMLNVRALDIATGYEQQATLKIRGQQSEQEIAAAQARMRGMFK